jgi:AraC-like DNA-binding protein
MIKIIQPCNDLKNYILHYCVVEAYSKNDYFPSQRIYPYGNVTLVFHYGSPSKYKKHNTDDYVEPKLVICGPQTSYYDLSLSGKTGMIFIVFKPQGVSSFFNIPISELVNQNISLYNLIKNEAQELEEILASSLDNTQRIKHIEAFLLRRIKFNIDFDRIDHVLKLIDLSNGQIKTSLLAGEACLGIKQFERVFSKHIGMAPKKYTNIIRFQSVLMMKKQNPELNMVRLAMDSGYYDQSHFTHEFKKVTGQSPRIFFSEIN